MLNTFYVETGKVKREVQSHSWQEAARNVLRLVPLLDEEGHIQLGSLTCVSTTGYDESGNSGGWLDTKTVLDLIDEDDSVQPDFIVQILAGV